MFDRRLLVGLAVVLLTSDFCRTAADTPSAAPLKRLAAGKDTRSFSGIYPHLAHFNSDGECGTGAVVPWAGRLWWVTYSPHRPRGSDDRLYAADDALNLFTWPGSVGGTPANRMIHRESKQLLIGPYVIDAAGKVRVIPPAAMPGRLTGTARHLTDPSRKVYYATMEEGFYEVDVATLAVTELFPDANAQKNHAGTLLPGYHGKGLYSGQGRLIYANNGELSPLALTRPDIESGVLAEWDGKGDWRVVRRNQFTEVSGPGGIAGNARPDGDPVWSIGWDHRSLLLMLLDGGKWHLFRLPKASHCYDGAHGWNTEWPRIREIGDGDLLMTMHGQFWRLPRDFRLGHTAGLAPRSSYLKVIGDFCRWGDRVVLGCDDAAKNEFLNTRKAKGKVAGPAQSQSNLWFVAPGALDRLGPPLGRGGVWVDEAVAANKPSDPYLFAGFARRSAHLSHDAKSAVRFRFEIDRAGDGTWTRLREVDVPAGGHGWTSFPTEEKGAWVRVVADTACRATVWFEYAGTDDRPTRSAERFASLARADRMDGVGGLVRAGERERGLQVLARSLEDDADAGYYELKPDLTLQPVEADEPRQLMAKRVAFPRGVLQIDGDSVLYRDDDGKRYRLPVGNPVYLRRPELFDRQRTAREAVTERDLFQAAGTFYELPARNAGGFARIRPVATHPFFVQDYCSWRGLLVLSGVAAAAGKDDAHVIRSADGRCAVWLGAIDDLWQLGKPVGRGGPWQAAAVKAGVPSDPYLVAGYDRKQLHLSHDAKNAAAFRIEIDITGTGLWRTYRTLTVPAGEEVRLTFPPEFQAYWARLVADHDCRATATFVYE